MDRNGAGAASRLGWYARRLTTMGASELAWRAAQAARHATAGARPVLRGADLDWDAALDGFRRGAGRPVLLDRARAAELSAAFPQDAAAVVAAADRVLDRRFEYFGYPQVRTADPVDWHQDPFSGLRWPTIASTRIDHRTATGDPKWIWELNRLQHLPWLAQAWLVTGDDRYADDAFAQLDGWIDANPVGTGIAWRGAFEVGIRAISVGVALQGLRAAPQLDAARYRRIVEVLAEGASRCWSDRSRFSSANNHLVGELVGLVVVALLFPELPDAARWRDRGLRALTAEARRQILPDGAGAEQAVGYQVFTAELFLLVVALLRLDGQEVPTPLVDAVARSADYLEGLVADGSAAPRYGDDDEGFALRLGADPYRTVRAHLATAAVVARGAAPADLTAGWFGGAAPAVPLPDPERSAHGFHAPHGGLAVLRADRSRRILMDVGPLGYESIAAHGHADALALALDVDGLELVGDPGTASYYGHPAWRAAHRSTRAHATVCLDGQDQSVSGGPFLWVRHATTRVLAVDVARGLVVAEHDGYRRLDSPAVHRRWLIAPPQEDTVLVVDLVDGAGQHDALCSWPLHPALDAVASDTGHLVRHGEREVLQLAYAATAPLTPFAVRGDEDTHLGWWSTRLESREPSWLVGSGVRTSGPTVLVTALRATTPTAPDPVEDLAVDLDGDGVRVRWREGDRTRRVNLALDGTRIDHHHDDDRRLEGIEL